MSEMEEVKQAFADFCDTIAALRHPKTGCPWDLKQDHKTLRTYMIEEAYEAVDAMGQDDPRELADELGDVLLQVVLNAQVAKDEGKFTVVDVIHSINDKMVRRHPHVFGDEAERSQRDIGSIKDNWLAIKKAEKGSAEEGVFDPARKMNPATTQALKIGTLASYNNFDWDHTDEVFAQLLDEVEELKAEYAKHPQDHSSIVEEMGDVYFSLAQLCRFLRVDPELVSRDANVKFLDRFKKVEELATAQGISIKEAPREQLESLWKAAKAELRKASKR